MSIKCSYFNKYYDDKIIRILKVKKNDSDNEREEGLWALFIQGKCEVSSFKESVKSVRSKKVWSLFVQRKWEVCSSKESEKSVRSKKVRSLFIQWYRVSVTYPHQALVLRPQPPFLCGKSQKGKGINMREITGMKMSGKYW